MKRRVAFSARNWVLLVLTAVVIASGAVFGAVQGSASTPMASSPKFLITPRAMTFGYVAVGSTAPQQEVTVKNVSGVSQTLTLVGGAAGVFGGSQNCQGETLAPGTRCHLFYAFQPTKVGAVHGATNGAVNGQRYSLSFTGYGTPQFLISPTSLAFGKVKVGETSPQQTITITNESNQPVVMNGAGGAAGQFGGSQNCQGETLAPGKSCTMFYAFSPTATGAVSGSTNGDWNGQEFAFKFTGTGT